MRKHNEGYALPFVLVVITVLTLVALSIASVSLRNLHMQETLIQRMQDKYAAQGLIEVFVAKVDGISGALDVGGLNSFCGDLDGDGHDDIVLSLPDLTTLSDTDTAITVTLTSTVGTSRITCELQLQSAAPVRVSAASYQLTNPTYEYISYSISTVTDDATPETTDAASATDVMGGVEGA